ncbi:diguanylate cyclase (GGDEF) domain-containing protein [[Luteovulum] sphaeroides subsp. megalophilum]|uniref:GGDEF domain-containing protein n=1 Tax=Cereibacter sphaeroides TaxID=1063 RepID=UPI000B62B758|nr:GGDEF domain-containing protein [Cereibacter sphaeroides]SNS86235.1 diguanylate cyclase (GGDEF) domain-containing protein [[Luteovulum] sphaeroides subsp. megalophilum]
MDWARRILYRQSLRGWMALALVLAVLPLLTSAVVGYAVYHRTIVSPFRDVLTVQHATLVSLERIHDDYWQVAEAVNGYLLSGDAERAARYAAVAAEVEAQFERLAEAVAGDPALVELIGVARAEWAALARDAEAVLARPREGLAGAVPDIDRVAALERELPVAAQRLEQIVERLRSESEAHHAAALVALRRLEIGAAAALILSVLMMGLGAWVVNRAIVLGTDRLVEGARRVASGQREEPVAVTVPPELAAVADAFNDMTRTIVEQEARLREFGRRDALTSLLNRREFDHALEQRAAPWTGEPYALLLIDIDRFKRINDTHGHAVGDAVLRAVALRLAASAREGLPLFRYGGEEFALLLDRAGAAEALTEAERLRRAVAEEPVGLEDGTRIAVTISVGIALGARGQAGAELFAAADRALYAAKDAGRNCSRMDPSAVQA